MLCARLHRAPRTTSRCEVDALAADRRVVTLDHRGHGHSTKTGRLDGYTIEQLSADLAALLEAVGGGPVDLLGHSMGGRVVMGARAGPARPGALADPDGHQRVVVPPARPGDPRHGARVHRTRSTPPTACPPRSAWAAPRTTLIEAATPAAVAQGEGRHLRRHGSLRRQGPGRRARWATPPTTTRSLRGRAPGDRLPDDGHRRRARPSVGRPGARAGGRGGGRPADRHSPGPTTRPQLTHAAEWRAAVEDHLAWARHGRDGGAMSDATTTLRTPETRPRRAGRHSMPPSRRSGWGRGPGATRARGAWAATTSP